MEVSLFKKARPRMDAEYAASLRLELLAKGTAILRTAAGARLFLVHSTALSMGGQGILLAYERGGVYFWEYATDTRPLTIYRLVGAGFATTVAEAIMLILDGIELAPEMLTHIQR